MKGLDTILGEAVSKMKPSTRKRFAAQTGGKRLSQEALISEAESMLREDGVARVTETDRPIKRNNGGAREVTESEGRESVMRETDKILFEGMEKARSTSKGLAELVEVNGQFLKNPEGADQLSESQRADYEFCKLVNLTHEEAIKVAKSGGIRG